VVAAASLEWRGVIEVQFGVCADMLFVALT